MRAILAILVVLAAAVASLPPGWCRALPESPACCDACHDEHEHSDDEHSDNEACQCNTLVVKQAEESPALPPMVATAATLELEQIETALLSVEPDDRPPPNYQRTLCRWRC
jgi:hypothetical protein